MLEWSGLIAGKHLRIGRCRLVVSTRRLGYARSAALAFLAAALLQPAIAQAAETGKTLLALPFTYLDTSGEPSNQTAAHAERLKAMSDELTGRLQATRRYRIVAATPGILACAGNDQDCLLGEARKAGADRILTGAVHKTSTLISAIWVGVFDAQDGKRVFYRQISFRGDTDEAWRHATGFVLRQLEGEAGLKQ